MSDMIHKPDDKYPDTHLEFRSELNDLRIDIKWDGCVNINQTWNGHTIDDNPEIGEDADYIHICNLPLFIKRLQQVEKVAREKGFEL